MPLTKPRICIRMATFNPPEALFLRQIDSLRRQSHANWTCVIQDDASSAAEQKLIRQTIAGDARFELAMNSRTLGFYGNFERALRRVPADCDLIALADQDDVWYPEKLEALAEAFHDRAVMLAYGDMRVTDAAGTVIAEHFSQPVPHRRDFESQFFTNTITGAACMFRASLLEKILPFPPQRGRVYHDWWIALVAMACGRVHFVDRVLQDYCQHADNAVSWRHRPRPISLAHLATSAPYRREMLETARQMYADDCNYLGEAIATLCERVPDSAHRAAMLRLRGLLTHPRRTMLLQYLRAIRSRQGSRRERNLLMAALLGRQRATRK